MSKAIECSCSDWQARRVVTEGWVDDEHLRALGRVVVAATWLETVLAHVVQSLVDDHPLHEILVLGSSVSTGCDLANRLAERIVLDPKAIEDLKQWTATVREATERRNQLLHAEVLESEDGWHPTGRRLIINARRKRKLPPIALSAGTDDIMHLAARMDSLSEQGLELIGRLMAGYRGRPARG